MGPEIGPTPGRALTKMGVRFSSFYGAIKYVGLFVKIRHWYQTLARRIYSTLQDTTTIICKYGPRNWAHNWTCPDKNGTKIYQMKVFFCDSSFKISATCRWWEINPSATNQYGEVGCVTALKRYATLRDSKTGFKNGIESKPIGSGQRVERGDVWNDQLTCIISPVKAEIEGRGNFENSWDVSLWILTSYY